MELTYLHEPALDSLSERLPCPTYRQEPLRTGIVHIGVGGFHRSHQAYYIHELLQKHDAFAWGISGVGLRDGDRKINEVLHKQDSLYTLMVQHPDGKVDSQIIGALREYLLAIDHPELVVGKLAHPDTKIVSLTITEGGYNFNASTGEFNFENPDIQHELKHRDQPRTVFGYLTAALNARRAAGVKAFTVLSCDNIQHNGAMAKKMLLAFVREQDPELGQWVEENVSFPNTMVDRITPVTTSADIDYLKEKYQLVDEWPVVCEPFIQWVIEDDFVNGRPPLEKVGVQFVPDVSPYEKMKIRLLNAGHSVLGIPGALHGHPTINACMEDPVFVAFMRRFMDQEATPVLGAVAGIDLEQYKDKLEERFANPNIKDAVSRICSESAAKLPKFLIPTIQENLSSGGSIRYASLIVAAWCYYSDKEVSEKGEPLEIIDAMQPQLREAAQKTGNDPLAFLRQRDLFGDLVENERFTKSYVEYIDRIYQGAGVRKLMAELL
ncbi:mannitol dehydrogenase family protein [Neolewinella agarilytica]|uniref:mannitol dehydrogenase family protein n=1 Tax=Neolewinella agarilytica TaxID=478744 RepID=UPI0023521E24|nr:mannitol dehydrogenase family protein [Neolewinella agarilytica]